VATLTHPIPVLLTPDQRAKVESIATAEGISMALVIRELIDMSMSRRKAMSVRRCARS
jgi:hypothetical protein